MPRTTIAAAVAEELARSRAMSARELGPVVAARGLTRARNPIQAVSRALTANPGFRRLDDDRWVAPAQLLKGATLTHRLTASEAESGVLALTSDLAPLANLARGGLLAPGGQPLSFLWDANASNATGLDTDAALEGPEGWLPDTPGTLLHVRLAGSILRVAPGPDPKPAARLTVRRQERAIDEAIAEARDRPGGSEALDPAEHPEVARALDEFIRHMEAGWVDEPIPALGGRTPRQALADDHVRPELKALLDDMTWEHRRADGRGLMDPARLRALLGMTSGG